MNLYIPEIGDHICLIEDWKFNLHPEHRNVELASFFNHYLATGIRRNSWLNTDDLAPLRDADYVVNYPNRNAPEFNIEGIFGRRFDYDGYDAACEEARNNNSEWVKWNKDYEKWTKEAKKLAKDSLEVVVPKGTVLAVDRIYIRKGSSDYSSITFFAKGLGETIVKSAYPYSSRKSTKKKALRFWAKLDDCNRIQFEKIDK